MFEFGSVNLLLIGIWSLKCSYSKFRKIFFRHIFSKSFFFEIIIYFQNFYFEIVVFRNYLFIFFRKIFLNVFLKFFYFKNIFKFFTKFLIFFRNFVFWVSNEFGHKSSHSASIYNNLVAFFTTTTKNMCMCLITAPIGMPLQTIMANIVVCNNKLWHLCIYYVKHLVLL